MKILHTTHSYSPSLDGVAEVLKNLSEGFVKRGHEVHVATSLSPNTDKDSIINNVHVHRFDVSGNSVQGLKGEVSKYQEFVCSNDWDIIVNHCTQTWATDSLLDLLGEKLCPKILVTHGLSAFSDKNYDLYYNKLSKSLDLYSKWCCISDVTEEFDFVEKFNLNPPTVITNGVNINEWTTQDLGLRKMWNIGDCPWVLNVSNHNSNKGHSNYINLAKSLKGKNIKFSLIGRPHLAQKFGMGKFGILGGCYYSCYIKSFLNSSVILKTNLQRKEVVSAIKEADILVSTSVKEANSIVILEAMAAKTPWVSFNVGSVSKNEGGVIVRNEKHMAEQICELLIDHKKRLHLGRLGRQRVNEFHSWDKIISLYEKEYLSVIGKFIY